jgi:hypothetical protein
VSISSLKINNLFNYWLNIENIHITKAPKNAACILRGFLICYEYFFILSINFFLNSVTAAKSSSFQKSPKLRISSTAPRFLGSIMWSGVL